MEAIIAMILVLKIFFKKGLYNSPFNNCQSTDSVLDLSGGWVYLVCGCVHLLRIPSSHYILVKCITCFKWKCLILQFEVYYFIQFVKLSSKTLNASLKISLKRVAGVDIRSGCLCRGLVYYKRSSHKVAVQNFLQKLHR